MCSSDHEATDREVIGVLFHLVIGLCAELAESDPERIERIHRVIRSVPSDRLSPCEQGEIATALRLLDRLDRSVMMAS